MKIPIFTLLPLLLAGCQSSQVQESEVQGATPVTVAHPEKGSISETVTLNATSSFQIKIPVKSDINGYLSQVNIIPGQQVKKGQVLFTVRTREAQHLGSLSEIDTSFRFKGQVNITAPADGFVGGLSYAAGDYVQEGEILVTISDANSLVFLLELPYELKPYAGLNSVLQMTLPDGKKLMGTFVRFLPTVDPVSQTQTCIIKVHEGQAIPENLVASVDYVKKSKSGVMLLPKDAILTNEVEDAFWIMKMADSLTAIKVPVSKGIENSESVEIVSPPLSPDDLILVTGNYGLPDTSMVLIRHND